MADTSKVSFPRRTAAKARTRKRIEDVARQLFVTAGYGDTTMAMIAEAADIHITTLFTHFPAKRDLAAAIAITAGERFAEVLTTQRARGVPVLTFWRNQVMHIARAYARDSDGQINLGRALADEPEISPLWSANHRAQIDLMAEYIAADMGIDLATDRRPQVAAAMLVAGGRMAFDNWMDRRSDGDLVQENEQYLAAAEAILSRGLPLRPAASN